MGDIGGCLIGDVGVDARDTGELNAVIIWTFIPFIVFMEFI